MAYDPSKPAQMSISGVGKRHFIQDGIRYAYQKPHDPLDPAEAAAREREIEAKRAASAPRVTLAPGEALADLGRGVFMIDGPDGERGPYLRSQVAHLLEGAPAAETSTTMRAPASNFTLGEGERLDERGAGWYAVVNAAGQQVGPARRRPDVAHLLGDAA